MKRVSLAAAFAASLFLGFGVCFFAADEAPSPRNACWAARTRRRICGLPAFHAPLAAGGSVAGSLDASLVGGGGAGGHDVEAREALASVLSLDRDVSPAIALCVTSNFHRRRRGDWRRPSDVGRATTKAKGTIAIIVSAAMTRLSASRWPTASRRPRPRCAAARDVSVSSGFGLRADPSISRRRSRCPASPRRWAAPSAAPRCRRPADRRRARQRTGGDGQHGDAARRLLRAPTLCNWQAAPRAGAARAMFMTGSISWRRPDGGLCRGRRGGGGRAPRAAMATGPASSTEAGLHRSTAISRLLPRASSRARRWCAASS